ncbi:hypothetical protein HK096_007524 [Nowakowskiella sp. JEL0078]|nr:hypothetical protein HK096_007524 [Nowakowskiella sp. JEL0078]
MKPSPSKSESHLKPSPSKSDLHLKPSLSKSELYLKASTVKNDTRPAKMPTAKSDLQSVRPSMIRSSSTVSRISTPTMLDPEEVKTPATTIKSESGISPLKTVTQISQAPSGSVDLQRTPLKFSSSKNETQLKNSTLKGDSQIAKKASPKVDLQSASALSKLRAPSKTGNVFKKTNTDITLNQPRAKDQLTKSESIQQKQTESIHSQTGQSQLKYSPRKTSLPKPSQAVVEKRSPEKIEPSLLPKSKMPKTSSGLPTRYPASRAEIKPKVELRSTSGSFRTQVHTSRLQSLKKK